EVVIPAAWLHDLVNLPKDHPERKRASEFAAFEALIFLKKIKYPELYLNGIHHAIVAHSFSAGINPESIEAKIVQDADRLDALGAVGLARLFTINSQLGRPFYNGSDPFALERPYDDRLYGIDHIFIKLKRVAESMNTTSASIEAKRRFTYIEGFLEQLKTEIE
ncbi:MAG: HD domain-containing protein, partial [Bdellovibrionales bacterium]|nr:HD domain-containing protein [Bdellovibrionales bacterium]